MGTNRWRFRRRSPGSSRKTLWLLAVLITCLTNLKSVHAATLVFPPYGHSYGIRKATPAHLFMFFGPRTAFDDPQGIAACKMISRDDPALDKDDDEVVVYGVNSGRHQLIYNTSMWSLSLFGSKGSGKNQFLSPKGVAAEPQGHVYVADWGNNRIVHLYNPKKELRWVAAFTGKTADDPGLNQPTQVALTAQGMIFVTDPGNRRLVLMDSTGLIRQSIPARGQPMFEDGPTSLAVADGQEKWSHFRTDRFVFCADRTGTRIWKIAFDGTVLATAMMPDSRAAEYFAVDYYNNLWATDTNGGTVLKFDRDLKLLDIFGSSGTGDNQFVEPRGIAIWKRFGQVFVAEKTGAQYYWMGTDLKSKSLVDRGNGFLEMNVNATEYSYVSLFTATPDTTWLMRGRWVKPGGETVVFRDNAGPTRSPGSPLKLRIEPTYSSYTYFSWCYPISVRRK